MEKMSVNKVILIGNLGKDPELRGEGTRVCNFSIACAERYKQGDEWKEKTEWINVVVFGTQAENCAKYLGKGSQVYIEGKLQTTSYEKDGRKIYQTKVVAHFVNFLSKKQEQETRVEAADVDFSSHAAPDNFDDEESAPPF
jgi:single-strand DNA-binding protein